MKTSVFVTVMMMAISMNLLAQRADPSRMERQIQRMKVELSLSDEQYSKLKLANEEFTNDQARLRSDTTLTEEKLMTEKKAVLEKHNAAIKHILTKEQYAKWTAMKPQEGGRGISDGKRGDPINDMKKEIGLSEEQAKKIKALNTEMTGKFQKLRADTTMSRASRPQAVRTIVAERNEKVKKILTEEQYEKFLAYENEQARLRRRGPRSGTRK